MKTEKKLIILILWISAVKPCMDDNCAECETYSYHCDKCNSGYYSSDGICRNCIDYCSKCENNYQCETCEFFYKVEDDSNNCELDVSLVIYVSFLLGFFGASVICYCFCCFFCTESQRKKWKEKRKQRKDERERVREFRRQLRQNRENLGGERRNPHPIFSEENRGTMPANGGHRATGEVFNQPNPVFESIFDN